MVHGVILAHYYLECLHENRAFQKPEQELFCSRKKLKKLSLNIYFLFNFLDFFQIFFLKFVWDIVMDICMGSIDFCHTKWLNVHHNISYKFQLNKSKYLGVIFLIGRKMNKLYKIKWDWQVEGYWQHMCDVFI